MAQLKDTIVSGNLRVTDTTLTDTLHVTIIKAPTSSGGSTYGPGTSGQVLKSNGTSVYWTSDSNTDEKVKATKLAQSTAAATYYPTLVTAVGTAGVSIFDSAKINHTPGTTDVVGNTRLILGNAINEGTADNEEGLLRIYSSGTKYHTLQFAKITNDHITHTFPTTGGTILNTGNYTSYTIPFAAVTGSADADTYAANTGWYNWNTTSGTNMPTENWGILLSKEYPSVQMFLPDTGTAIYLRKKTNASTAGTSWMGITGTAGNTYNLNNFLPLSGGTMTGTIRGTYSNTHIALAGGGIGDYGSLDHKNNINISSWNGVSISNGCSTAGTLDQVTFSVNARTGTTQQRGNAILYSESGNSPALIFQRGTFLDNAYDWRIYANGNNLYFEHSIQSSTSTQSWVPDMMFIANDKQLKVTSAISNTSPCFFAERSDTSTSAWFGIGSGGVNHGIYSGSINSWVFVANATEAQTYNIAKNPSTATTYAISFGGTGFTTGLKGHYVNDGLGYRTREGIANTEGLSILVLGNSLASSVANNKTGYVRQYSTNEYYTDLKPNTLTARRTILLPDAAGTIAVFPAARTSGQVVITDGTAGAVKSSGYTIAKSVPSDAKFTDVNVLQSDTSSTSDFRPILLGTTHTTTVSDLSATITGQAYVSSNIFVKPNTGIICAKEFSTVSYINGTGAHLEQYGLYLKSYKAAALPAGGNYSCKGYVVRTYDGKSANNGGMLLTIDGGGLTIVGSGSASSLADLISDDQQDSNTSRTRLDIGGTLNTDYHGASEYLILSSNKSIVFLTNCKTIADRKPVVLDTALRFYPGTTETGSIGISSYQWNTIYGKTIYENGTSLASKYAAIGHTHGLLHSDLNQASTNGTTGGWSVIGIDPTVAGYVLKSIRINQTSPNWLSGDFGAGIAFGGSDTKGVISMRYQYPVITFAGGNHNSSKTEPTWYLKISGTSGSTYNLANFYDSTISRTANTVLAAPNGSNGGATFRKLVAADIPALSYLPTAGGTMEGNISFKSISGDTYPIASNKIIWNGGTDGIDIYYNLRSDDAGELIMNMRDDTNVRISFAYKGTVKSYIDTNGNFSGNAYTTTKLATARTINGVSFDGSANITIPRSIKHIHKANGTDGSGGWVNIARITVTEAYADQPMTFTIAQRGTMQYRIHLLFTNNGTAAATEISQFIITRDNSWTDTNNNPRAYIIKPSDGIFDLYIRKTVTWDCIFVVDFTKADENGGANYSVTWKNVHAADSAITGGTEAVKKLYLPTTTNYAGSSSVGGAATSANKLNTNAGAGDRPVYFSGGIPVQCAAPASGSWWKGVPLITTDGVMEIGKYIDFHKSNDSTADYDLRLQYTGTATGKTVTIPGASGYVALLAKGGTSFYGMLDGDGSASGWIRATSNGFIPSAEARFFQTATSSLGTSTWYFDHSYIQNMSANRLVLGVAKMTDGAAKGQVKFFSGNANDTTGTVTLECVNDSTRTGDYTVKLPTWNGTIPVFEKLFEGASNNVSLSFSDINEYDLFLITVANSNATTEQVTVASLWISNIAGVHDMPLIWGGTPSSSGGACNVTSGWIQLSKNSGTTTFVVAHKPSVAQMTSSGWTISSPTYNLYIRKIFGLKAYKRT